MPALVLGIVVQFLVIVSSNRDLVQIGLETCKVDRFCNGNVSAAINTTGCCRPCSCDRSCALSRNCCPDADIDFSSVGKHPYEPFLTCESFVANSVDPKPLYRRPLFFTMVSVCPDGNSCRPPDLQHLLPTTKLSSYVIVSDKRSGAIFINKQCAICHGVNDFVEWNVEVEVSGDPNSILESLISEPAQRQRNYLFENHRLVMIPPENYVIASERFLCYNIQTICDMEANFYSAEVNSACLAGIFEIMNEPYRTPIPTMNPFCLRCKYSKDEVDMVLIRKCATTVSGYKTVFTQYNGIFRLLDNNEEVDINTALSQTCNARHVFDTTQNMCRQLYCPPLLRPHNGKCELDDVIIQNYRYITFLKFTYITPASSRFNVSSRATEVADLLIRCAIKLTKLLPRCVLRSYAMKYVHTKTVAAGFFVALYTKKIERSCGIDHINVVLDSLYTKIVQVELFATRFNVQLINVPLFLNDSLQYIGPNGGLLQIKSRLETVESVQIEVMRMPRQYEFQLYANTKNGPFIRTNNPFTCPYFILNHSDICDLHHKRECDVKSSLLNKDVYAVPEFTEKGDIITRYRMCIHTYFGLHEKSSPTSVPIGGIISFTLSIISLICIVPTVIVMVRNRMVDTIARKLFLASVGNLFLAQAVYQFGSGWINNPIICKIAGIAVHFSWLATVFSFNSFCILVYRQIRCANTEFNISRSIAILLVYTYVTPILLVLINVAYSEAQGNGSDIGYGDSGVQCNLNRPQMRGLLFALPIFLAVLCNIFVFAGIVYSIRCISAKSSYSYRHVFQNAQMYFRLLMFTGIAWLIGFINEFVQSDILGVIFSIAIGGQGIGFCLAFSFNVNRHQSGKRSVKFEDNSLTPVSASASQESSDQRQSITC